jgi:myo-inositol-1(or 4)-monophosphatase
MSARINGRAAGVRSVGSAALELAWVASGRYDGYWHHRLEPWDMAAGMLIVREAGGIVRDLAGNEKNLETGALVAGNPTIHEQLLSLLALTAAQ